MTFQVALVGCDGLVIGSDRLGTHAGTTQEGTTAFIQKAEQKKYVVSDTGSLICFAAGGYLAPQLAQQIALKCDFAPDAHDQTVLQWQEAVSQLAHDLSFDYESRDEILIARHDVTDRFWIVRRAVKKSLLTGQPTPAASITDIRNCLCTGDAVAAVFLGHFWNRKAPIAELQNLAALMLSYAAQESQSVGPPFDIMCLHRSGEIEWKVVPGLVHQDFDRDVRRLINKSVKIGMKS